MYKYTPKCPYCGSTNTKKISHFGRGFTTGIFLPFKMNKLFEGVGKEYHCNNCKRDF